MRPQPPPDPAAPPEDARGRLLADLHAVVVALDRRNGRPGRTGEAAIAAAALALRREAVRRIGELEDDPAR
jgi:hypothetical protein